MKKNVIIEIINEDGERVIPQGFDFDKFLKRFTAICEALAALLGVVIGVIVIINTGGGGGGFRINRIIITPLQGRN
jgi:hypothetical protein